jgi:hypothetical protein
MAWIPWYFLHQAEVWIQHLESGSSPGSMAYAKCQAANWRMMAVAAVHMFRAVNPQIGNVWGFE